MMELTQGKPLLAYLTSSVLRPGLQHRAKLHPGSETSDQSCAHPTYTCGHKPIFNVAAKSSERVNGLPKDTCSRAWK